MVSWFDWVYCSLLGFHIRKQTTKLVTGVSPRAVVFLRSKSQGLQHHSWFFHCANKGEIVFVLGGDRSQNNFLWLIKYIYIYTFYIVWTWSSQYKFCVSPQKKHIRTNFPVRCGMANCFCEERVPWVSIDRIFFNGKFRGNPFRFGN